MYQLMLYQFSCYCHINNSMRLTLVNDAFITWKVHLMEAQQMFYFMFLRNIQHFHFLKPDSSRLLWKNMKIYSTLGVDLFLMFPKNGSILIFLFSFLSFKKWCKTNIDLDCKLYPILLYHDFAINSRLSISISYRKMLINELGMKNFLIQ